MKGIMTPKIVFIFFASLSISGLLLGGNAGLAPPARLLVGTSAAAAKAPITTPQIFCASTTQASINISVCAPNSSFPFECREECLVQKASSGIEQNK